MLNKPAALAVLTLALGAPLCAQLPRPFYAWWANPVIVQNLNLKPAQKQQVRATVRGYHNRLLELRAQIERAESDLAYQFDQQPVDERKTNEAVERLAAARGDLTRTLSQMSFRLRTVLSREQWQDLQRRRPVRGQPPLNPTENEK